MTTPPTESGGVGPGTEAAERIRRDLERVRRGDSEVAALLAEHDRLASALGLAVAQLRRLAAGTSLVVSRELLDSLIDGDECWFDHHGGCQAHGYLSLQPGELCPQMELKQLLDPARSATTEGGDRA